jgi:cytochrome c peroxidase
MRRHRPRGDSDGHVGARSIPDHQEGADDRLVQDTRLRNVLVTGPYFHDGSQETLWDVMDHYNKGEACRIRGSTRTSSRLR